MTKDLSSPLKQARKKQPPRKAQWRVIVPIVAVLGVSTWLASQNAGLFRTPTAAESLPEPITTASIETTQTEPAQNNAAKPHTGPIPGQTGRTLTNGGAAIIKVNPEDTGGAQEEQLQTAHLPVPQLVEEGPYGPIPRRDASAGRPFDAYAGSWSGVGGARIAIIVGGMGVSQSKTKTAINVLPPQITLAFASAGNSLPRWMQEARQRGHEILLQIPLEPFDYPNVNPGNNTLTVSKSAASNIDLLHRSLGRLTNYTGVMNYMGGRFMSDSEAFRPVLGELAQRGLLFVDDGSSARSIADPLTAETGTPFAAASLNIDTIRSRGAILKKLDELEEIARAQGFAIGTATAFDITVQTLNIWTNEVQKRGIEIVPISALARDPEQG